AWVPFPCRDTLFLLIVALMIVPIQTSLVPLLKLFAEHGHLNNGYWGIWLAHTAFGLPLAVFLLRNFFITLPKDLIEAARMDGASNMEIFRRIVLPLSVPALASFGIFQFLWVWNDLLMALIFLSGEPSNQPMTVRIPYLLSTYGPEYHLLSAAAFLLMFLPLIVFFALQRYFVQGLLACSVKTCPSISFRTRTGAGSGTARSSRSESRSWTPSTRCSTCWRPTRACASRSTDSSRPSTTTSRSGPRERSASARSSSTGGSR